MKRLNLDHVSSLARAESLMIGAIVTPMSPVLRKSVEDDIERLTEIKRFILSALYQPGLPFTVKIPEAPDPDGDTSSS